MLITQPRFPVKDILLFGFWPSPLKKLLYRLKGYRIGKGVSLGLGSVICAQDAEVGDHTKLSFFSILRGRTVRVGKHVSIGAATIIDTPHLEIGDGSKFNEQVFVGGLQFPDSKLVVGRNCQIMQMTFINPTRSIVIGDDTGIGGHCLLFGHTSWLSKFEGYPVEFKPIEIGRSVSIAWRVFVLAGSTIGDGAVIGADSLVNRAVPPRCLAVGFPARVVSKPPEFPRDISEAEKEIMLKEIVADMVSFFQGCGLACREEEALFHVTHQQRRWWGSRHKRWRLRVLYGPIRTPSDSAPNPEVDVVLSLRSIPTDIRREWTRRRLMWIDIESKERSDHGNDLGEEVVLFLRRYGVRFFRVEQSRENL